MAHLLPDVRALLVDADPPSARLLAVLLGGEGARTRTARAAEAVAVARAEGADLAVVDVRSPGGPALLAELARALPAAALVAVSVDAASEGPARDAGAHAFFVKPIDVSTFAAALAGLTRRVP